MQDLSSIEFHPDGFPNMSRPEGVMFLAVDSSDVDVLISDLKREFFRAEISKKQIPPKPPDPNQTKGFQTQRAPKPPRSLPSRSRSRSRESAERFLSPRGW